MSVHPTDQVLTTVLALAALLIGLLSLWAEAVQ